MAQGLLLITTTSLTAIVFALIVVINVKSW